MIRHFRSADADGLFALTKEYYPNSDIEDEAATRTWTRTPGRCLVAEEQGKLVGYLTTGKPEDGLGLPPGTLYLEEAFVSNQARRQGVFTGLYDAMRELAVTDGYHSIAALVLEDNTASVAAMRKHAHAEQRVRNSILFTELI